MGFTVEQECPQCGAPIELDETDHLIRCPYCEVKNYLFAPNYFRYLLPHQAPDKEIIYVPYLRFKGNVYSCKGTNIDHRVVDISHVGLKFTGIPISLGLRPQAMKMQFVTPETAGSFLRFTLKAKDIILRAGNLSSGSKTVQTLHWAFIGETLSLIYLPTYIENNKLFDAILNRPIRELPEGWKGFGPLMNRHPRWKLTFIPTLCPQCGWDLDGQRNSVVLTCSNCDTAWEALKGKFTKVKPALLPGRREDSVYLPFWKITASTNGIEINSFADFIRHTNQPRVVGKEWQNEPMSFWSPAFKIRPKTFLKLSRQFTCSQQRFKTEERTPKKNLYPSSLPLSEAKQALKIILANATVTKRNVFPYLRSIQFNVKESLLVYLPFTDSGHDLIQQHMNISINKSILEFGRQL